MQRSFNEQQILNGDVKQLSKLFNGITSTPETLRTNTAEQIFDRALNRNPLDAACAPLLAKLKNAFIAHVSKDDAFYCDETHPFRLLLSTILKRAITWYPRDAKPNQQFFEKLTNYVHLITSPSTELSSIEIETHEFIAWNNVEEKRASMLESRLCESELNHLKILTAECRVLDLINESLAGSFIPKSIFELISITLKSELSHCVFTSGIDSPFWKIWQRLLPLVNTIFNNENGDDQQRYRQIPVMLAELERSLSMEVSNPDHYNQFVDTLSQALMLTIKKQTVELSRLNMLPYPAGHSDTHTRVTDSVLQQSSIVQQGSWILFASENNHIIRCKLALKNAAMDQLLFVDRTGRKVMIKSSKDFSLCISAGIVKPIIQTPIKSIIEESIKSLIELQSKNNHQQQQAALQEQQREKSRLSDLENEKALLKQKLHLEKQKKEQQIKNEQQKRALAFSEQRRAAAEKALAEAQAFAEEKTSRAIEAALIEKNKQLQELLHLQAEQMQKQFIAQEKVNSLNVGAWIEILDDNQQKQRCKLAVVIASAGKYIFVDSLGRKIAEYQREDLLKEFINQKVFLINNGDKFEDQLVKVIRSLRKDIY